MLVKIAIGDAYGAGFEFAKPKRLEEIKNDLSTYYPHNLPGHLPAGSFTDDTQMSTGITEHIVEGSKWTPEALADRFVDTYKRDPRNGYSRRLQAILDQVKNGEGFRAMVIPISDRCGAAMRSCPIGVYKDEWHVVELARKQAKLTHNTSEGEKSSAAIALSTHFFLHRNGRKEKLVDYLKEHSFTASVFGDEGLWPVGVRVTSHALPCVKAAVSAVVRNDSMSELLKECIAYTGDVDSVAAMAMGIASCTDEVVDDLPQHLYDGLENGAFGRDYLAELDRKLLADLNRG